ncbi:MAG: histidine kinase [Eubacteriales bacterium]|nr:histidine kinase [Eubacteriales bacterium]
MKRPISILPRSIFARFALAFIVVGLMPLLLVNFVTLNRSSHLMEQEALLSTQQMVSLVADNLNARFQDVGHQTGLMYLYDSASFGSLRDILSDTSTNGTYFGMRDFTKSMLDSISGLRSAYFWDTKAKKIYSANEGSARGLLENYDWSSLDYVKKALDSPRELTVSLPHTESYFLTNRTQVISFCRAYLDPDKLPMKEQILGVLILDVPYRFLSEALSAYDWAAGGELHIVDKTGVSLYSSSPALVGEQNPLGVTTEVLEASSANGLYETDSMRVIFRPISSVGWYIEYELDMNAVTRQISHLRGYLSWMILLSAVCAAILAILCSRNLSAPIQRMLSQMKRVRRGELDARVEPVGQGEMGELCEGFNQMVVDLNTYIDRSYLARIQQTEAELNELKTQIHPHFLYNTLEVIRMTALEENAPASAGMVESLARQFKYVIGELRDRVPLRQELKMTRDYVSLVATRYGAIQLEEGIPGALLSCMVLKLCLQPVVENAVQHGLRPKGGGRVSLTAVQDGNDLLLTVMDDGVGMTMEQTDAINQRLLSNEKIGKRTEDGWRGIGLKNVHDRLRLACGPHYGLTVQSMERIGTAVVIRLPFQKEAEQNEASVH